MSLPHVFVFGPQSTWPSSQFLSELRASILVEPSLRELFLALKSLSQLGVDLAQQDSDLQQIIGIEHFKVFEEWLDQGSFPLSFDTKGPSNLLSMCMTIIIHLVQYSHYLRKNPDGLDHPQVLKAAQTGGVQGFCIGLLSAISVGCAETDKDVFKIGGTSLRLAATIGAYVDLDTIKQGETSSLAIRWNSSEAHDAVINIIKSHSGAYISVIRDSTDVNITAPTSAIPSLTQQLAARNILVKSTGLGGRCHTSGNENAFDKILKFIDSRSDMILPDAATLRVPIRTNVDGRILTSGPLHKSVLRCVLVDTANWYSTMAAALAAFSKEQQPSVVSFGLVDGIPASIIKESGLKVIKWKNADLITGSPSGQQLETSVGDPVSQDTPYPDHAVAIIGMACKFPGADSLEEFWDILSAGTSMCREMPAERFDTQGLRRSNDRLKFWGNFVNNADAFDHKFFKKSSREAASMDPQQRSLLEVAYAAMESAGYFGSPEDLETEIGVYIGACSSDYNDNVASHNPTAFSSLGTLRAFLSGRISHWFNWTGPSITYDTACSSSAVAIDAACKAIQTGDCLQAVAGGVSLYTSPNFYQNLAAASFLSATGQTKPFDAQGDGYCRGEGTGLVVLKKLSAARKDNDNILGVIVGSAVNQNQNCTYITVPHGNSQQDLYRKVVSQAKLAPTEISYVEAHGTGTPVGDPIEFESIRNVFAQKRSNVLNVASVKGNIGHLEGAAGVAALIKVCLMLQKSTIPVQASFKTLNPNIGALETDNTNIPTSTRQWDSPSKIACVNNYGAAGSNAAMIVREAPPESSTISKESLKASKFPLYISANSASSLSKYCAALLVEVRRQSSYDQESFLADLTFNLADRQNRALSHSIATTVTNLESLKGTLEAGATETSSLITQNNGSSQLPVVLCFGGQVNDFIGLDRNVFASSSKFRSHLEHCDRILRSRGHASVFPGIFQSSPIKDVVHLHSMLFSFQYAAAKAWIDSGLKVDAVVGHSFGQLTAFCISGSLSLEDTLILVCGRASLMKTKWGSESGSMISIEADISAVLDIISTTQVDGSEQKAEIACYNGPTSHVLVGSSSVIDKIEQRLSGSKTKFRRLNVTHGFHSRFTEPLLDELKKLSEQLTFSAPEITLETCSADQAWNSLTPQLIAEHTRTPVYFAQAIARISQRLGVCTWIEAGSNSSITGMARRVLEQNFKTSDLFLPLNLRPDATSGTLADVTVSLWRGGYKVQFWPFHRVQKSAYTHINLPPYQFEKSRHWLEWKDTVSDASTLIKPSAEVLTEPVFLAFAGFDSKDNKEAVFHVDPRSKEFGLYVRGHSVLAEPLCPAPLYMELASKAARMLEPNSDLSQLPCIEKLNIQAPLGIDLDRTVRLVLKKLTGSNPAWTFEFSSYPRDDPSKAADGPLHATGTVTLDSSTQQLESEFSRYERLISHQRLTDLQNDLEAEAMQGAMIYNAFEKVVTYAPYYKGVRRIFSKGPQVTGIVMLPNHEFPELQDNILAPLALDNFFQVAGLHTNILNRCGANEVFVCTKVDTIRLSPKFKSSVSKSWIVYSSFSPIGERELINDIFVIDPTTNGIVMFALGAFFTKVSITSLTKVLSRANRPKTSSTTDSYVKSSSVAEARLQILEPTKTKKFVNKKPEKKPKSRRSSTKLVSTTGDDVRKVLSMVCDLPVSEIKDDSTLDDLGIDSLMIMEVLSEVQTFFKLEIPSADWQTLETPRLLAQYLSSRGCGNQIEQVPVESDSESNFSDSDDLGMGDSTSLESLSSVASEADFAMSSRSKTDVSSLSNSSFRQSPADLSHSDSANPDKALINSTQQAFENTRFVFDKYAEETGFSHFWKKVYPTQARLVLAYTVEAFQFLGCDLSKLPASSVLPSIEYLPRHEMLIQQLFTILEDGSLVARKGEGFTRTETLIDKTPSVRIYQQILDEFPLHSDEHKLLHLTGSKLAQCLNGTADPLQLLFAERKNQEILANVYRKGPMFEAITKLLGSFLVKSFTKPGEQDVVHILELGGGTGGTTNHVMDILTRSGISFTYTFTDLSNSLVAAARRRFKEYKNMEFTVIDIEKTPPEKHIGKYHAVISTNCIHATRNLTTSTTNIHELLRPDGFVSVVEFTRNIFWFDLVFGLLDGWWLFEDGRKHVLADQWFWDRSMRDAGFKHVTWTDGPSEESQTLRIITAFSADPVNDSMRMQKAPRVRKSDIAVHTLQWKQVGNCKLMADIYLPPADKISARKRPVALMIHGGASIIFTRKEVNLKQVKLLLDDGFLPISVDYRLCPEVNVKDGAMTDVCDALRWCRHQLPGIDLGLPGLQTDGDKVVVVGWSTGGYLAMTTAFTSRQQGLQPPEAILAFYCPTDYESDWWKSPIYPVSAPQSPDTPYDLLEGVQDEPIASYYPATNKNFPGMLMSLEDPRWRLILHMNWKAQHVPVLVNGLPSKSKLQSIGKSDDEFYNLPIPTTEQIAAISPYAQIVRGNYQTPTYLIHGTGDDLIPWEHSQRVVDALKERGVESGIELLDGFEHLFDTWSEKGWDEIQRAYQWVAAQV